MKYNYTAYYENEEERIKNIVEDILSEYPNLGSLATEAAKLEKPFGRVHEDYDLFSNQENHINRLIDIVLVTEGKPEFENEYRKACQDLVSNYESWKRGFTYANPNEQAAYLVMQRYNEHLKDKSIPLITFEEATKEQQRRRKEKELKRKADMLRSQFSNLGDVADEVIKLEDESGIWIRFQENDIIRLVSIIKLTENREQYIEVYKEAIKRLKEKYEEWQKYETYYMSEEKQIVVEMINRLNMHMKDKTIPIATYIEIKEELSNQLKSK